MTGAESNRWTDDDERGARLIGRDIPGRGKHDLSNPHGVQSGLAAFGPPLIVDLKRSGRDTGRFEVRLDGVGCNLTVSCRDKVHAPDVPESLVLFNRDRREVAQGGVDQRGELWRRSAKDVLDAVEERPAFVSLGSGARSERLLRHRPVELLDQVPLLAREVGRHFDSYVDVQIALT